MRRVSDHDIDYPARLAAVVAAFQSGGTAAALEALQPIAYHPEPVTRRRSIPPAREVEVFRRDAWTCRYCGQPTVFLPVMAFLGHLFPDQFPYDPHWKAGVTHPAVSACGASVDHVVPVTRGGTDDLDNLVTACWPCNARKGDFTLQEFGREPRPPAATDWDGLSSHFPALWAAAGQPAAMRPWVSALALDPSLLFPQRQ
jgi:5-methylcytosine-specific restriction endonuclease McrA